MACLETRPIPPKAWLEQLEKNFVVEVRKNAFFEARFGDPNKFEFFGGLMGHPNKIWQFSRMPALVRTYWGKIWKIRPNILPEILEIFIWPRHL